MRCHVVETVSDHRPSTIVGRSRCLNDASTPESLRLVTPMHVIEVFTMHNASSILRSWHTNRLSRYLVRLLYDFKRGLNEYL